MAFTTVTNGIIWQTTSFLNEYAGAQREREIVNTGSAATSLVVVGDNIQSISGIIGDLQSASLGMSFIDPSPADYNGEASLPSAMSSNEIFTAASIPDGFRRLTNLGDISNWEDYDDAGFSHGAIQVGDIIGPWIFVDLQAVYGALTRTIAGSVLFLNNAWWRGEGSRAVWADAKDDAEVDYQDIGVNNSPHAIAEGSLITGTFHATIRRSQANVRSEMDPIGQERTVTFYLEPKINAFYSVFDAQNDKRHDGVTDIVEDVLNKMLVERYTGAGSPGSFRTSSGLIGSVAAATFPATWSAEPAPAFTDRGWVWNTISATADWNFEFAPSPLF